MRVLAKLKTYWTLLPFLIIVLLFELLPLASVILRSFGTGTGGVTIQHYIDIFSKQIYLTAIRNSLWVSIVSAVAGIVISFITAMAIHYSSKRVQNAFMSLLNMTSGFAGLPLAFAYIILLGTSGVLVLIGKEIGFGPLANFNLYSSMGLALIYIYFQIPLGTLLLIPSFHAIRSEWRESAALMKANSLQFWLRVGVPTLVPSIIGTFTMLFANALAAFATAYMLILNNVPLLPVKISEMFISDMRQRPEFGSALSVTMLAIMLVALGLSNIVKRLCDKEGK